MKNQTKILSPANGRFQNFPSNKKNLSKESVEKKNMAYRGLLFCALLSLLFITTSAHDLDSGNEQLAQAINRAIITLRINGFYPNQLYVDPTYPPNSNHPANAVCGFSSSFANEYPWPSNATGTLENIISSRIVKIGYPYDNIPNYQTLIQNAIFEVISNHYGVPITIQPHYFRNKDELFTGLKNGLIDVTAITIPSGGFVNLMGHTVRVQDEFFGTCPSWVGLDILTVSRALNVRTPENLNVPGIKIGAINLEYYQILSSMYDSASVVMISDFYRTGVVVTPGVVVQALENRWVDAVYGTGPEHFGNLVSNYYFAYAPLQTNYVGYVRNDAKVDCGCPGPNITFNFNNMVNCPGCNK